MKYLQKPEYYEELYDLHTIETCLDLVEIFKKVGEKMQDADEIKHMTDSKKESDLNLLLNQALISKRLARYKDRETSIEEWIEKDRQMQNMEDNTPPPKNIVCDNCENDMKVIHHLSSDLNLPSQVLFIFECKKCDLRKSYYDNGEKYTFKKDPCKECSSETKFKIVKEGDIKKWVTTCTSCNYEEVDIHDTKKDEDERTQKEKKEEELLKKYRKILCIQKKEADELTRSLEEQEFAQEVYDYELTKYEDFAYEKAHNLNKITIAELGKLLARVLRKEKFENFELEKPQINNFVEVRFITIDSNSSRNRHESTSYLKKLINKNLVKTNWRLTQDISYRLGYLTGNLKGYEHEEDILKLLGKKDKKSELKLDPKKLREYGHANTVNIARMSAEYEGTRKIRMKKLETSPEGFFLKDSDDGGYTCNVCRKSIRGSKTWWLPEGFMCKDCHLNIKRGLVPIEIIRNSTIWFSDWDLKAEFGLHSATIKKYVRNGDLVTRKLKDKKNRTYHEVFMAEDNAEFFKSHKRVRKKKRRWHYIDENGEVFWL